MRRFHLPGRSKRQKRDGQAVKHFIGGWALTALIVASVLFVKSKQDFANSLIGGSIVGVLGGLAAWGLLP